MKQQPSVIIIVLNWNNGADTIACLDSLAKLAYANKDVLVIDNGSVDDSVAAIRTAHPQITLIEAGDNLGYVGGNNLGLEYARGQSADYALLLNNDTEVAPDFLNLLIESIEADPSVGITGPMIYYFNQPEVIWSAGGAIDWQQGTTQMMGLNEVDKGQFGQSPYFVDFVTGCALLINISLVEQVGSLDPRFFAYFEETEWCVRVSRNGYKILQVPAAKIWHKISPVAREASPQVHYYMTRNRLLFLKLAKVGLGAWLNTLLFDYARTLLSWTIKSKWRHKSPQRRAMLQAILDYQRGHFGRVEVASK
jgi:GT2 family glycosyltransferase